MLRGVVLDEETNLPVAGAIVRQEERRAVSDREGVWRLDPGEPHGHGLRVKARGYLPGWAQSDAGPSGWTEPAFLTPICRQAFGRVVGTDGAPLAGVSVRIPRSGPVFRTGEDGRFGPVPLGKGPATWAAWSGRHACRIGKHSDGPLNIVLWPAVYTEGVVTDGAGQPLPGVEVIGEVGELVVATGEDGRFRCPLSPGQLSAIWFRKAGYTCDDGACEVVAGGRSRWTMRRSARVSGRVVAAAGGPPPPGLLVTGNRGNAWLDPEGRFDLERVHPVPTALDVSLPMKAGDHWPFVDLLTHRLEPAEGATIRDLELRLPPLRPLRILVRDAVTGRPVAGASVPGGTSGADGVAVARVPGPEDWPRENLQPVVTAPGYVPTRLDVRVDDEYVRVDLVPAVAVRLRAVDEAGRAVPGASVYFRQKGNDYPRDWREHTDPAGRAELSLPRGAFGLLKVWCRRAVEFEREIEVGEGLDLGDAILRPEEEREPESGPTCRVHVRDETGRPVPDAWFATILADRDDPVDVGAEMDVPRRHLTGWVGAPGREFRRVSVGAEAVTVALRPAAPVRARLLDAGGRPLPVHRVYVIESSERIWSDPHGAFRIDGFPVGERVRFTARFYGYPLVRSRGVAGGPEVVIRLAPRGTIRIRGVGRFGEFRVFEPGPLRTAFLEGEEGAFARREGDDLLVDCPAGTWPVQAGELGSPDLIWPEVEVRAGEETVLDWAAPRPGRLKGRLIVPEGETHDQGHVRIEETGDWLAHVREDGTFEADLDDLERFPAGPCRLRVQNLGHAPVLTEPVDLRAETEIEVRFTRRRGGVKGRLVDAAGSPLEGKVLVLGSRGYAIAIASTGEDGAFTFEQALGPGPARLETIVDDRDPVGMDVEVRDGETTEVRLVVR